MRGSFLVAIVLLLASALGVSSPVCAAYFPDPTNPNPPAISLSGSPTVNGFPLLAGDEVVAYSVHQKPGVTPTKWEKTVVGHQVVVDNGVFTAMAVYGDDATTSVVVEGCVAGEEILLVLWRASEGKEYHASVNPADNTPVSLAWTSGGDSIAISVDFREGQRIPLRSNAWNLFSFETLKGIVAQNLALSTAPRLVGATYDNVPTMADAFPLKSIMGKYDRIIGNDGGGARLWVPTSPAISTLSHLSPGYGYWIKMKVGSRPLEWMTVLGPQATGDEALSLRSGWTLLGSWLGDRSVAVSGYDSTGDLFPPDIDGTVSISSFGDLFSVIHPMYDRVTGFDGAGAKLWNPSLPQVSTMKYAASGYGYWVKTREACVFQWPRFEAPTGLSATQQVDGSLLLTWDEAVGAGEYEVFRSEDPTPGLTNPLPSVSGTSTVDNTVAWGTSYHYGVSARIGGTWTAVSTLVDIDTPEPEGTVATPSFTLASGTYFGEQSVTLSTTTDGATIRFTTDGSIPTALNGSDYSTGITVSTTTAIRAAAFKARWAGSSVASATYTIKVINVPPTVLTLSPTDLSGSMATFNGEVNPNGVETEFWFEWGADNTFATYTGTTRQAVGNGTDLLIFSDNVATLFPSTTYYCRAVARNSFGTTYGDALCITTTVWRDMAPVASGAWHVAALRSDGAVMAFGGNAFGQLGDGTTANRTTPVRSAVDNGFISVAAGYYHTIAVSGDHTLWAWGNNSYGQLGDGTTQVRSTPMRVGTDNGWISVAAGSDHTVALKSDGSLWAWGANFRGQLGDGTMLDRYAPVRVGSSTDWRVVAAGRFHTLAIKSDGSLWAWGSNVYGQLGDGTFEDRCVPVRVGGNVAWWRVAAGERHSLAVRADGSLWTWGANARGQLGDGTNTDHSLPARVGTDNDWAGVAAGHFHSIGISTDNTLRGWGANDHGQADGSGTIDRLAPSVVAGGGTFADVSGGESHSAAMTLDGLLIVWGNNDYGQQGDGTTTGRRETPGQVGASTSWTRAVAGANHSLALRTDGALWAWGANAKGRLGDGTTTNKISPVAIMPGYTWSDVAGGAEHTVAIRSDGTLWGWGSNVAGRLGDGTTIDRLLPKQISAGTNWSKVAAGGMFTVAIRTDNTMWWWGCLPVSGTEQLTAVQVGSFADWTAVVAGDSHILALRTNGTLWAWGMNMSGQVGDGTTNNKTTPVQIGSSADWTRIAAGKDHSLGVRVGGSLWAWGSNLALQLGDGSGFYFQNVPVSVSTVMGGSSDHIAGGAGHSLAIRSGALYAWGLDTSGQLGADISSAPTIRVGTSTNWSSVATGYNHTLAVKADGTLWAWGSNSDDQLGNVPVYSAPHTVSF